MAAPVGTLCTKGGGRRWGRGLSPELAMKGGRHPEQEPSPSQRLLEVSLIRWHSELPTHPVTSLQAGAKAGSFPLSSGLIISPLRAGSKCGGRKTRVPGPLTLRLGFRLHGVKLFNLSLIFHVTYGHALFSKRRSH